MAKVKLSPILSEVHGRLGDLVFRRTPNGKTIVYKAPKKSRGNTRSAQKYQQNRMNEAHAFARAAMDDPERKAYYEAEGKKKKKSPYLMALAHFWEIQRRTSK